MVKDIGVGEDSEVEDECDGEEVLAVGRMKESWCRNPNFSSL